MNNVHHRSIRSFVVRAGRTTAGQARALADLWPVYGIEFSPQPLDLDVVFGRHGPRVVEIGFGNGEHLAALAAQHPERDYLGIEVHRPGVGHLMLLAEANRSTNVRAICHDAVDVLAEQIPPASIDELLILFPDPWHKKRHHKRRLIQPEFVNLAVARLKPGGVLRLATDWQPYAEQMLEVLRNNSSLANLSPTNDWMPRPDERAPTRFEKRGARLGHGVWDLAFERRA
ncbi:MAG TPA: tRNA (guanosine(46)-N7)-methyltransferase TrmB [Steroidobacteraceae bacterium]|nr:tRNA (guanosine(46)-N7)-methyltransferase TrmB [Steroidobacteraceae bacterium]HRX87957.1 tRNA (guanosine(46)-N7)-methyltransferase TrmB [Steroidobacteraceae bacterium]